MHGGRSGWNRIDAPPRIRGRRLQALRKRLFADSPLCVLCRAQGRISEATIRDHIVPLAEGGLDDDRNVQALCVDCSDAKTQREAERGLARVGAGGRIKDRAT
jgi:5-methylcytosine-specific restriction protein A